MLQNIPAALQNSWLAIVLTVVIAYLLGSVSSAVIVSKTLFREDVREKGSGNAGATNVLRNYGKKAALYTTIGDLLKSMIAVFVGGLLLEYLQLTHAEGISEESLRIIGRYLGGAVCVFGHLFPIYFGFKGGKGVMTALGLILILDFRVALLCLSVFGVVVALSRMVSLGSVLAVFIAPFLVYYFGTYIDHRSPAAVAFCVTVIAVIVLTIILKHSTNIVRIFKGTESKLQSKNKK